MNSAKRCAAREAANVPSPKSAPAKLANGTFQLVNVWSKSGSGVVVREEQKWRRTALSLLPLWEKVARTTSAPDEGFRSASPK
jgi:hypothetical protein